MIFDLFRANQLTALFVAIFAIGFMTSCDDDMEMEEEMLSTTSFEYIAHNGQVLPDLPYSGIHPTTDFKATMALEELSNGNTQITVTLDNTVDGATYHMHAHDAADASTTPNGTPYNESPNADVLAGSVEGNGGTVMLTQEAAISYEELTTTYEGFFVIHDPLQAVSTVDITTYLTVGAFARTQPNPATAYASATFVYDFNTGQVSPDFAYAGAHPEGLEAAIEVNELADGRARVVVRLNNTIEGETYPMHAHDMADPSTTPNGTPYIEMPNGEVLAGAVKGAAGTVGLTNISSLSFSDITTSYDGFFVVHDPLQAVSTTDPTTYVVLGVFAR